MTAGIKTLEILARPGAYEYLDRITGRLINGLLEAGRETGHAMCGGHISGARLSAFKASGDASELDDALDTERTRDKASAAAKYGKVRHKCGKGVKLCCE